MKITITITQYTEHTISTVEESKGNPNSSRVSSVRYGVWIVSLVLCDLWAALLIDFSLAAMTHRCCEYLSGEQILFVHINLEISEQPSSVVLERGSMLNID